MPISRFGCFPASLHTVVALTMINRSAPSNTLLVSVMLPYFENGVAATATDVAAVTSVASLTHSVQ